MQNANQLEKDFMDSKEVAKLLCLKVSTIYSWIHYGQLPKSIYRKLGKKIIFIRQAVLDWVYEGAELGKRNTERQV